MMNKKAFTLVELIAVIVVFGMIALIIVPIMANVIKSARRSSAEKAITLFGKAVEEAATRYDLENGMAVYGDFITNDGYILKKSDDNDVELSVNYNGSAVICSVIRVKEDKTVYLNNCSIGNQEISGYSYGTN